MTYIESIRQKINDQHILLETARRADDADSAQAVCIELANLYRVKFLHEQQTKKEKEGVIV